MSDNKVIKRIHLDSWQQVSSFITSPHTRYTVVTMASYMTIGTVALIVISSVFCLFLFVTMVDDIIRISAPHRVWTFTKSRLQLDWPFMVGKLSEQLTYLAEWEKQKRTSWYHHHHQHQEKQQQQQKQQQQSYDNDDNNYKNNRHSPFTGTSFATNQDDTFHDVLFTITGYLNNYVHSKQQQRYT